MIRAKPKSEPKARATVPRLAGEVKLSLNEIRGIDPCNCRPGEDGPVDELAADLAEHGQLQAVIVRPAPGGGYRVLAGGRRWRGMKLNHAANPSLGEIRARVYDGDDEHARELSLAENIARESLHPLDEAEAFAKIAGEIGLEVAARRYGRTSRWARERVALANLSPRVKYAWRDEDFGLESARALASTPHHEAQDALLDAPDADSLLRAPLEIRQRLKGRDLRSDAPIVRFVGLGEYLAAGGVARQDFFDDESILEDTALVERLAAEKRAAIAKAVREAEGWGFVAEPGARCHVAVTPDYLPGEAERLAVLAENFASNIFPAAEAAFIAEEQAINRVAHMRAIPQSERTRYGVRVTFDSEGRPDIERALKLAVDRSPSSPSASAVDAEAPPPYPAEGETALPRSPPGGEGRHSPRRDTPPRDAPLSYAGRRVMYVAPTVAIAPHVAASDDIALRLAIVVLAGAGHHMRPVRLERAQSVYRVTSKLLRALAPVDFAEGLALAFAASIEEARRAFREIVASAIDLRAAYDYDAKALISALAPNAPALRDETAAAFDYAAFFREAGRAVALRAIRDVGGEALERSHASWRKDADLFAEAATLAHGAAWLPEEVA